MTNSVHLTEKKAAKRVIKNIFLSSKKLHTNSWHIYVQAYLTSEESKHVYCVQAIVSNRCMTKATETGGEENMEVNSEQKARLDVSEAENKKVNRC